MGSYKAWAKSNGLSFRVTENPNFNRPKGKKEMNKKYLHEVWPQIEDELAII